MFSGALGGQNSQKGVGNKGQQRAECVNPINSGPCLSSWLEFIQDQRWTQGNGEDIYLPCHQHDWKVDSHMLDLFL